jgi:hypothetical protein
MTKWFYLSKLITSPSGTSTDQLTEQLNALGQDGWELVSIWQVGGTFSSTTFHVVMKKVNRR